MTPDDALTGSDGIQDELAPLSVDAADSGDDHSADYHIIPMAEVPIIEMVRREIHTNIVISLLVLVSCVMCIPMETVRFVNVISFPAIETVSIPNLHRILDILLTHNRLTYPIQCLYHIYMYLSLIICLQHSAVGWRVTASTLFCGRH